MNTDPTKKPGVYYELVIGCVMILSTILQLIVVVGYISEVHVSKITIPFMYKGTTI
jgi:hypothetical protein